MIPFSYLQSFEWEKMFAHTRLFISGNDERAKNVDRIEANIGVSISLIMSYSLHITRLLNPIGHNMAGLSSKLSVYVSKIVKQK